MLLFSLITEYSLLLLIPCLGMAFLYSWIFYRKDESLNEIPLLLKWILRIVRFILVMVIAFFLLSPMFRYFSNSVQKPIIIFAVDNSESIAMGNDSMFYKKQFNNQLNKLTSDFGENYDIQVLSFSDDVKQKDSLSFNGKHTDFSKLFSYVQATYSNRNVGALVIASDGIYNSGSNPLYLQTGFKCPVYTIALGDTVHYKDLSIEDVIYNKVAFKGNRFSLKTIVQADKAINSTMIVTVKHGKETVSSVQEKINSNEYSNEFLFEINADNPGLQHYQILISPVQGEITTVNNFRDIVVDVLESKQKVLLLVNSPHPDAGAIKAALETNPNFDLTYSTGDAFKGNVADYNVVFLHQIPSKSFSATQIIQNAINAHVPLLFILGSQTSLSTFNRIETGLQINQTSQKLEEAYPVLNNDFVQFQVPTGFEDVLKDYPPLNVPFGDYKLKPGAYTLFQQRIKTISTSKPLMVFYDNFFESRVGIICGEGLWRWRLKDYYSNSNHEIFYDLINKITQYLSLKIKKEQFNVTCKNIYPENEPLIIGAELYNDNFEPVNDPEVVIEISNPEKKKFPFSFNKTGQFYQLNAGIFSPGDYTYTATTQIGEKKLQKSGKFVVAAINIESSKLIANRKLMEQLALKNNGKCYDKNSLMQVATEIKSNKDVTAISYSEKKLTELIQLKTLFFALLLLLSFEWFIRKYFGSY
jgi:hypothetical protein